MSVSTEASTRRFGRATPPTPPQTLGAVIARFRGDRTVTQSELARRINRDNSLVCRIEKGQRNLGIHDLEAIARGLSLNAAERRELIVAAGFHLDDPDDRHDG